METLLAPGIQDVTVNAPPGSPPDIVSANRDAIVALAGQIQVAVSNCHLDAPTPSPVRPC